MVEVDALPLGDTPLTRHWDRIYTENASAACSWHETEPRSSLEAILACAPDPTASIVDVGGGESRLVDLLLARGRRRVTVVDISARALERARARLGEAAEVVQWVAGDVAVPPIDPRDGWPGAPFAVWHDRAVFHFLTTDAQQHAYIARLRASVPAGGHVIIAAFDETGPERCSALPVVRRSPASLSRVLPPEFVLTASSRFAHVTPWGASQDFARCIWQRVTAAPR